MSAKIAVKPAELDGRPLVVRDPSTGLPLPAHGRVVDMSPHWRQALRVGDVVPTTPQAIAAAEAAPAETEAVPAAPVAPASRSKTKE